MRRVELPPTEAVRVLHRRRAVDRRAHLRADAGLPPQRGGRPVLSQRGVHRSLRGMDRLPLGRGQGNEDRRRGRAVLGEGLHQASKRLRQEPGVSAMPCCRARCDRYSPGDSSWSIRYAFLISMSIVFARAPVRVGLLSPDGERQYGMGTGNRPADYGEKSGEHCERLSRPKVRVVDVEPMAPVLDAQAAT